MWRQQYRKRLKDLREQRTNRVSAPSDTDPLRDLLECCQGLQQSQGPKARRQTLTRLIQKLGSCDDVLIKTLLQVLGPHSHLLLGALKANNGLVYERVRQLSTAPPQPTPQVDLQPDPKPTPQVDLQPDPKPFVFPAELLADL